MKHSYTSLIPLIFVSILTILCVAIIANYVKTANREGVVIVPGGVTYTGR